jgi:hypothetical protein
VLSNKHRPEGTIIPSGRFISIKLFKQLKSFFIRVFSMTEFKKFNLFVLACASAYLFLTFADAADRHDVPIGDCPSLGPENAPVTIIEFIDYQ